MKTSKPRRSFKALSLIGPVALALAAGVTTPSCSAGSEPPEMAANSATRARFGIELAPGQSIDDLSYTITGPHSFELQGTVPVESSTRPSFVVGNLQPGAGYEITITGTLSGSGASCSATASFAIVADETTNVTIHLLCQEAPGVGGVSVTGDSNICPQSDSISALPSEVVLGSNMALTGFAHDSDGAPNELSHHWTILGPADFGTFSDPTAADTTFTCNSAGEHLLALTVSDGDCEDTSAVSVTCSSLCPRDDGDPCTIDVCQADGETTSHVDSGWQDCPADLPEVCAEASLGEAEVPALEACARDLSEALTMTQDYGAVWANYQACINAAIGCSSALRNADAGAVAVLSRNIDQLAPALAPSSMQAQASSDSVLCEIPEYLRCSESAQRTFDITLAACVTAAAIASPFVTPAVAAGGLFACTLEAVAAHIYAEYLCDADARCHEPQVCLNWECVDSTITVLSATYGPNCGVPAGNVTGPVASECNGRTDCEPWFHNQRFGDPAVNCAKSALVEYRCQGSGAKVATHPPVVMEGYTVSLSCP